MPIVTVTEDVTASPARVYDILSDMAAFPSFMKNVESVRILERGPGFTLSEWVTRLQGARFRWVERDEFFPEEGKITYRQIEGDLKVFQGHWALEPGLKGTRVTLQTEFEFGIPMLAALLNPVAKVTLKENARAMIRAVAGQSQPGRDPIS